MKIEYVCMNLLRRPDRRFVVERTMPRELRGLLTFLPAIDGTRIHQHRVRRWKIGNTGYAVNLTKRLLLRKFLRTDADALFLFEDDVSFEADFWLKFQWTLANAPSDWEMLFLGGNHSIPAERTYIPGIVRCVKTHLNHAVVIRRRAARAILTALGRKPFLHPLSDQTIGWLQSTLPTYAPERWAAGQRRSHSDNNGGVKGNRLWNIGSMIATELDDDELTVMKAAVGSSCRILQWGACRSTLLLAHWSCGRYPVVCFENNEVVLGDIRNALNRFGLADRVLFFKPGTTLGPKLRRPMRIDGALTYQAQCLDLISSRKFDICVAGGPFPVDCALEASALIPKGGLLFLPHCKVDRRLGSQRLTELSPHYDRKFEISHTPKTMTVFERV